MQALPQGVLAAATIPGALLLAEVPNRRLARAGGGAVKQPTTQTGEQLREAQAVASKAEPPEDWPPKLLATWAARLLRRCAAGDARELPMQWTHWPSLLDPNGTRCDGTWPILCAEVAAPAELRVPGAIPSTAEEARAMKGAIKACWSPGGFAGDKRKDGATEHLCALVLDCDDSGDWLALLAVLEAAGLAYLAHRSPGHCDGKCKWRLVVPLSTAWTDTESWNAAYNAARIVFGAAGAVWFDPSAANPSRLWYGAVGLGDAAPLREVRAHDGATLSLEGLAAAVALCLAPPPARRAVRPRAGAQPGETWEAYWRDLDVVGEFQSAGLHLRDRGNGMHTVLCPWRDEHTGRSTRADSSAAIWTGPPKTFECKHAHCVGRKLVDALEVLGVAMPPRRNVR